MNESMNSGQLGGDSEEEKTRIEKAENYFFRASAADFKKIPGSPIAYWVSDRVRYIFCSTDSLGEFATPRAGLATGDNPTYQRFWTEVAIDNIFFGCLANEESKHSHKKWYPCNSGGDFRKWFGNNEIIVNWQFDGAELRNFRDSNGKLRSRPQNTQFFFKPGITWTKLSSSMFAARLREKGFVFDDTGRSAFPEEKDTIIPLLSMLCGKLTTLFLKILNPSMSFTSGDLARLPIPKSFDKLSESSISQKIIRSSRNDWDSYETSWEFTKLPLPDPDHRQPTLEATCATLRAHWQDITLKMQRLEEENNRIFIEAYGLQDELTPEVPLEEITLTCNPHYRYGAGKSEEEYENLLLTDTMKGLISYAIGCMMGRYSLDQPGLIYAHSGNDQFLEIYHEKHNKPTPPQNKNHSSNSPAPLNRVPLQGVQPGCNSWSTFPPDQDGIIPITDTDWFPDDASNRFIEFISVVWPKEHLEKNLKFVAESLSPNRGESPRETIRRYISTGFFKHHLKMYKKRPIYWLFSSGKLRAFQCLVYLHRYNEGTLSRMRTEYVIPLQRKIAARIEQLSGDSTAATFTAHRKKLERERDKLAKQQAELQTFDEKLRHYADQRIILDLDDGVKVNYGKFGDLLAEVQAVTGKKKE